MIDKLKEKVTIIVEGKEVWLKTFSQQDLNYIEESKFIVSYSTKYYKLEKIKNKDMLEKKSNISFIIFKSSLNADFYYNYLRTI